MNLLLFLSLVKVSFGAMPNLVSINGAWTEWSTVATPCLKNITGKGLFPVSCGGGKTIRRRSCTNPAPQVNNET